MGSTEPGGALQGIRVLDLSRVIAGPMCTQVLADLGADVIKVERPGAGDDSRGWAPPYAPDPQGRDTTEGAVYCSANRGKRSISINLQAPQGRELVRSIALQSDVLIENYKAGTLEKYGLGYEQLRELNPRLVYCSITGFGKTGPYRDRPGYDTVVQAMGGIMSITGPRDGSPGAGPMKVGAAVTDFMTGLYAAVAIQAAIIARQRTGVGQEIDLALLDVQVASIANVATNYLMSGEPPQRCGNRIPSVYPSDAFRCSDGFLMLIVGNDDQFRRFCGAIGRPELAQDERFILNSGRLRNADLLAPHLEAAIATRTVAEWTEVFEEAQVPYSRINDMRQVFEDPQVQARDMLIRMPHPTAGQVPLIASPLRLSDTPVRYQRPPPMLGEHTAEVLEELLGLTSGDIEALQRAQAI